MPFLKSRRFPGFVCLFGRYSFESFKVIPLFSCQGGVLFSVTACIYYHIFLHVSTTFLFFVALSFYSPIATSLNILTQYFPYVNTFFLLCQQTFKKRRRRDLNPRAAINDLHPFQGCPFGQLGYFSMWQNSYSLLSKLRLFDLR